MAKSYNITFNITGNENLSPAIQSALKALNALPAATRLAADKATRNISALNKSLAALGKIQADVDKFKALKKESAQTAQALANAQKQVNNLARAHGAGAENAQKLTRALNQLKNQQAQLKAQQSAARDAMKAARSIGDKNAFAQAKADAQRFTQELKNVRAQIKQTNADLKENRANARQFDAAKGEAARLKALLQSQQQDLQRLRTSLGSQGFNTSALISSERALQDAINQTTQALAREQAALERRSQIANNFQNAQQDMSNAWSNFQNSLDTAKTIMNPFTGAIDKAVAFEHTMSTLRSISQMDLIKAGDTAQAEANMARLTAQAKELGATTIYTTQEIGEAMVYIARTGWDTPKISGSITPILKLAAANRMGIERTADIVTNVMTAFGHDVDQIGHDTDVFAYTVTHSNQTLEQFGDAMKYAAPVAKMFGASIEEAAMMTKFMVDAGVQGSMAGTAMRQTMLRLTAPTKNAQKMFEEMGISASDARKEQMEAMQAATAYGVTLDNDLSPARKFISIMEQLDKGMAGQSDQEKLAALKDIVGVYAVSGAANLFGAGAGQAQNFTELLENCRGALSQTYDEMTADTFGAQKSFESAWEAIQLSVGESLLGITKTGYEIAAPKMASLSKFIDEHQGIVQAAFAIAAAIATATVAVAGFSLVMAGVRFAQAGWATAGLIFSDLATKITAARTALAGLTFANIGATLSSGLTAASAAARAFGASMLAASRAALAFVFTPVGAVLTALALAALYAAQNWERVAPALDAISNAVSGILLPAFEAAKNALANLFDVDLSGISNLIDGVGSGLVAAFIILGGTAASVLSAIAAAIADIIKLLADAANNVKNFINALTSADFSGMASSLKSLIGDFGSDLADVGIHFGQNIMTGLQGTNAALETYLHPSIDAQPIDTAQTQASLDAVGNSALNSSTEMQTAMTNAQTAAQSALTAGNDFQTAGVAAQSAVGGLNAMTDGASAVAGALAAKAAEIGSIHIPQPQLQVVTVTQAVQNNNAAGGIYGKGAFVTSFAEEGPEAAIPLDRSPRAISLWQQAGQMLGMDSSYSQPNFNVNISVTINGNANADDVRRGIEQSLPTVKRTFEEEFYSWQHERARRSYQ